VVVITRDGKRSLQENEKGKKRHRLEGLFFFGEGQIRDREESLVAFPKVGV